MGAGHPENQGLCHLRVSIFRSGDTLHIRRLGGVLMDLDHVSFSSDGQAKHFYPRVPESAGMGKIRLLPG